MWLAEAGHSTFPAERRVRRFCPTDKELIDFMELHKEELIQVEWVEIQAPLSPEEKTESQIRQEFRGRKPQAAVPLGRSGETE